MKHLVPRISVSLRLASLAACCLVFLFRLRGSVVSKYWLSEDSDVGAVVCRAEFVRSLCTLAPAGVVESTY